MYISIFINFVLYNYTTQSDNILFGTRQTTLDRLHRDIYDEADIDTPPILRLWLVYSILEKPCFGRWYTYRKRYKSHGISQNISLFPHLLGASISKQDPLRPTHTEIQFFTKRHNIQKKYDINYNFIKKTLSTFKFSAVPFRCAQAFSNLSRNWPYRV